MPQYFADIKETEFFLLDDEAHHAANVQRHKEGEQKKRRQLETVPLLFHTLPPFYYLASIASRVSSSRSSSFRLSTPWMNPVRHMLLISEVPP